MTSAFALSLTRSLFVAATLAGTLSAATISYTVTNLTSSGGDNTFSIASDVTFNNLSLRENFADATSAVATLYDFSNVSRTSLDTTTFDLHTLSLNTIDPTHGALVSATLTGVFGQTSLSIVPSFGATPIAVTVSPNFTATLQAGSSSVFINAIAGNTSYAAGTLESTVVPTAAVPEPGTYAIASLGILILFVLGRRQLLR